METTACPYGGTRLNHPNPMNVSALRPMRRHWDSVMGYLDELSVLYAASQSGPAPSPSARTGGDLWRIAKLAECVPQFLLLRCREPLGPGALPASVAAMYKMALGLKYALHWQVESAVAGQAGDTPIDAAKFLEYVERRRLFIGPHQVCAGPEALVVEVIERIAGQGAVAPPPQGAVAPPPTSRLRDSLGDLGGFCDYAALQANIDVADALFRVASLDWLMSFYEGLRGVEAGWRGDYRALAWLFEQVNAALAAARGDYFLPDLAGTSAGTRAGMIDALMNLVTEPVSGELGREQVEAVRALATSCGPAAEPMLDGDSLVPVPEGLEPGMWRQLLALLNRYLRLESAFVDCIAVTDAALEIALGDPTARPSRAAASAALPRSPSSILFETVFGSTIDHTRVSSTLRPVSLAPTRGM